MYFSGAISVIVVKAAILQVAIRGKIDIGLSFDSSIWFYDMFIILEQIKF